MELQRFLEAKPLFYDTIDIERMPAAWRKVRGRLRVPEVVHIVGTNGKGTTGRALACLLHAAGYRVGHYTSPHLFRFNERIWIDGEVIDNARLEAAHTRIFSMLGPQTAEALSYFEYTTFVALAAFEPLDYVVLEAGLGGEFDATNVVPKTLSVVTPIGLDHQAFLGETMEAIAATKLRSMQKRVLLARQEAAQVDEVARTIARQKGARLFWTETILSDPIRTEIDALKLPAFLRNNYRTAVAAFSLLTKKRIPWEALQNLGLRGRFEQIAPNIVLDVGHNPMAAAQVAEAMGPEPFVLIYNALADKDVEGVLAHFAGRIERLELFPIEGERAAEPAQIQRAADRLGISVEPFRVIHPDTRYLVFGSFYVAEAFLRSMKVSA